MTTVNVGPLEMLPMPVRRLLAELTVITVAPEVMDAERVVCCERDVYLRTVIYLPIGCSERGLGTEAFA